MSESTSRHESTKQAPAVFPAQEPAPGRVMQGAITPQGTLAVYEPGSGKLLGEVRVATAQQVRDVVQAAKAAQVEWARKTFAERREVVLRFKELLLQRADEFCDHITRENGKTRNESLFMEVLPVADATHWYANNARKLLKDEKLGLHMFPHKKSYLRFYPRGVIGIIAPWNYPFSIPAGDAVAALMAGNAVVVKPSEFTPIIMDKTRALLEEAGLPRGLFGVVHCKGEVGADLIRSGINMIVFTGSVATGKKVNVAAAEQMIPCVLELGGKDPAIVLPDADLDSAAKKIAWGAFANSGQTCASVERVYVQESIAKPFIEKVTQLAKKLRQREPHQHDVDVGAMTTQMQGDIVRRHIEEARARGAKTPAGGESTVTPQGARCGQPTARPDTTPAMPTVRA